MINRRDSRDIPAEAEREVLSTYSLRDTDLLGSGTESKTYILDDKHVLKIYADPGQRAALEILQDFYDRLGHPDATWVLPHIDSITEHGELLAVVERRIPGQPMEHYCLTTGPEIEQLYLETVRDLGRTTITPPLDRRLLLPSPAEPPAGTDWHGFLTRTLESKLPPLLPVLQESVSGFEARAGGLLRHFALPYTGFETVIHGDLYPGNILMTDRETVSGIIDFGTFTMIGDPLYDLACACSFYRMYEPDHAEVRTRLLATAAGDLDGDRRRDLHAYVLVNALLTCDLYPEPDRPIERTGHFQWAVEILAADTHWQAVGGRR
ncbi:aminoglycoside phosphotransferase family protein [Nocardia stercoris]|uniref:Aminoglycoside phosphotransferase family protein n=1 Tax=Nocardia stercoris TaxID=2483361 RepID=A0A3M2L1M3_9NOCA|nr:aminoglycoside phosphotransferase family protein [Nocardia stercoris]RMI28448.1 aminoglycoside phosphotransferase family protein [Nocardia stercoris]